MTLSPTPPRACMTACASGCLVLERPLRAPPQLPASLCRPILSTILPRGVRAARAARAATAVGSSSRPAASLSAPHCLGESRES